MGFLAKIFMKRDALTSDAVCQALGELSGCISVKVVDTCASTNAELKNLAESLAPWYSLIALEQTQGRGRLGRSFFSPAGTGLYMSVLLRPRMKPEEAVLLTAGAAVAVCRAVEEMGSAMAEIKWVNDVYIHRKKVCGILAEAGFEKQTGAIAYVVLGIGVNVIPPEEGFPPEVSPLAGAVFDKETENGRARLAAGILRQLYTICSALPKRDFVEEYRRRNFLPGNPVIVLSGGQNIPATALAVDNQCRLLVRYRDGTEQALFTGEVSVHPADRLGKTEI